MNKLKSQTKPKRRIIQRTMSNEKKEEEIIWYIYRIKGTNYIGSTKDIHHRRNQHQTTSFNPNDRCYNYPVYKYIRLSNINEIELEILDWKKCDKHNALLLENEYIKKYDSIENGQNNQLAYLSREEKIKRARVYYKKNKDEINSKKKIKWTCPICLSKINNDGKARHNKRIHFTNPPTETREEYVERKKKRKEEQEAKQKENKKKSNALRKNKKSQCERCDKILAYGTLQQHYKYCKGDCKNLTFPQYLEKFRVSNEF